MAPTRPTADDQCWLALAGGGRSIDVIDVIREIEPRRWLVRPET